MGRSMIPEPSQHSTLVARKLFSGCQPSGRPDNSEEDRLRLRRLAVRPLVGCLLALVPSLIPPAHAAAPPARVGVLLDTDIGDEMDDALALAGLLSTPRVQLAGVTTVTGDSCTRALVACRFLEAVGRPDVPVASASGPRATPAKDRHLVYGLGSGFRKRPEGYDAVTLLYRQLKARPCQLTVLAIG